MDVRAVSAALRVPLAPLTPEPDEPGPHIPAQRGSAEGSLVGALRQLDVAIDRQQRAEAEASRSRRPSTLKATLKTATAVERARAHVRAELRLLAAVDALLAG